MQVAEILSDLTSLKLCDPKAALAMVTARPTDGGSADTETMAHHQDNDPDLKRAKDLLELHASIKVGHEGGIDKDLNDARESVAKVLNDL